MAPVATVATTTMSSGCACAASKLLGGVELSFTNASPGSYRLEVHAWNTAASAEARVEDQRCIPLSSGSEGELVLEPCWRPGVALTLFVTETEMSDGPRQLTLRVFRDGVLVHTEQLSPSYEHNTASGIGCDDEAYLAKAVVALP